MSLIKVHLLTGKTDWLGFKKKKCFPLVWFRCYQGRFKGKRWYWNQPTTRVASEAYKRRVVVPHTSLGWRCEDLMTFYVSNLPPWEDLNVKWSSRKPGATWGKWRDAMEWGNLELSELINTIQVLSNCRQLFNFVVWTRLLTSSLKTHPSASCWMDWMEKDLKATTQAFLSLSHFSHFSILHFLLFLLHR